ncbi:MAG: hypothetical protein ACFFCQ_18800 [Promethearchaeota archaeon]
MAVDKKEKLNHEINLEGLIKRKLKKQIGFFGLDGSGKTSFLTIVHKNFGGSWDPFSTEGIEVSNSFTLGYEVFLQEFGCEKDHQDRNLFSKINFSIFDIIFYLIDIQTPKYYEQAVNNLGAIIKEIGNLAKEKVIVCFHKLDPGTSSPSHLQRNLARIYDLIDDVAPNIYAIHFTSVFYEHSICRAFIMAIRAITSFRELITNQFNEISDYDKSLSMVLLDKNQILVSSDIKESKLSKFTKTLALACYHLWQELLEENISVPALRGEIRDFTYSFLHFKANGKIFFLFQLTKDFHKCPMKFGELPEHIVIQNILKIF